MLRQWLSIFFLFSNPVCSIAVDFVLSSSCLKCGSSLSSSKARNTCPVMPTVSCVCRHTVCLCLGASVQASSDRNSFSPVPVKFMLELECQSQNSLCGSSAGSQHVSTTSHLPGASPLLKSQLGCSQLHLHDFFLERNSFLPPPDCAPRTPTGVMVVFLKSTSLSTLECSPPHNHISTKAGTRLPTKQGYHPLHPQVLWHPCY